MKFESNHISMLLFVTKPLSEPMLLIEPMETNFDKSCIKIQQFSYKIVNLKLSSGTWGPFCRGLKLNVLI